MSTYEWKLDTPKDDDKVRYGWLEIRRIKEFLTYVLSQQHVFPGVYGSTAGKHKLPLGVIDYRESVSPSWRYDYDTGKVVYSEADNFVWYVKRLSSNAIQITCITTATDTVLPSGTRMIFFQETAPLGWKLVTSFNDLLLFATATETYNQPPSSRIEGSWFITITLQSHSHQVTISNHQHGLPLYINSSRLLYNTSFGTGDTTTVSSTAVIDDYSTNNLPSMYTSGIVETVNPTTTSSYTRSVTSDGTWRPYSALFIVCEKE